MNLKDIISSADPNDDALFKSIVNQASERLRLDDGELATIFTCSIDAVKRWKNGRTSPHPSARYGVYKIFLRLLNEGDRDEKILEIAKGCLGITNFDQCRCPDPKHNQVTIPLVDLMQALQLAYKAGQDSKE